MKCCKRNLVCKCKKEVRSQTAGVTDVWQLEERMEVPEITREMCMELIKLVTVDKCPGKYSKAPREIHIYYKVIDKQPLPEKKYTNNLTCEAC